MWSDRKHFVIIGELHQQNALQVGASVHSSTCSLYYVCVRARVSECERECVCESLGVCAHRFEIYIWPKCIVFS